MMKTLSFKKKENSGRAGWGPHFLISPNGNHRDFSDQHALFIMTPE